MIDAKLIELLVVLLLMIGAATLGVRRALREARARRLTPKDAAVSFKPGTPAPRDSFTIDKPTADRFIRNLRGTAE